eukprot:1148920-Pelagomonas_calceolata.AAC.5
MNVGREHTPKAGQEKEAFAQRACSLLHQSLGVLEDPGWTAFRPEADEPNDLKLKTHSPVKYRKPAKLLPAAKLDVARQLFLTLKSIRGISVPRPWEGHMTNALDILKGRPFLRSSPE